MCNFCNHLISSQGFSLVPHLKESAVKKLTVRKLLFGTEANLRHLCKSHNLPGTHFILNKKPILNKPQYWIYFNGAQLWAVGCANNHRVKSDLQLTRKKIQKKGYV